MPARMERRSFLQSFGPLPWWLLPGRPRDSKVGRSTTRRMAGFGRAQSGCSPVVGWPNRAARISVVSGRGMVRAVSGPRFPKTRPDVHRSADENVYEAPLPPSSAHRCRQGRLQRAVLAVGSRAIRGCRPRRVLSDPCGGRSPTRSPGARAITIGRRAANSPLRRLSVV